jgi:solute carrier family 35 protein E1
VVRPLWENRIIRITILMVGWYISSIAAGIYNKAYLNIHPLPVLLTMSQSVIDVACCVIFLSLFMTVQKPRTWTEIKILGMLGLVHCVGTALTNWSTLESTASFTHTIKASEPLFSVLLSVVLIGARPTPMATFYICLATLGIALTCLTEFDFQFLGFATALLSNVVFATRGIYSKKLMDESKLDNQNVFLYICVTTCLYLVVPQIVEVAVMPSEAFFGSLDVSSLAFKYLMWAAFSHYLYNMFSFLLLKEIGAVSHSVWNSFKRLFIIYFAVLYFKNHVSIWNALASILAVVGVIMYSTLKETMIKPKVEPDLPN